MKISWLAASTSGELAQAGLAMPREAGMKGATLRTAGGGSSRAQVRLECADSPSNENPRARSPSVVGEEPRKAGHRGARYKVRIRVARSSRTGCPEFRLSLAFVFRVPVNNAR